MKKIIVAPLNWGLGHATRCVPIIELLVKNNFTPILASDGNALQYLKKEFPELETIALPSYDISYAKNLKWHLLSKTLKIRKAILMERNIIEHYVSEDKDVIGMISDNRFGVRSTKVHSVYITHQINVLSGWTTFFTSYVHQRIIKKFDECWIPDEAQSVFSGKLSESKSKLNQRYIGILSRFKKEQRKKEYDVAVVLSGVEPNRSELEKKLLSELKEYDGQVVFIRGVIETKQRKNVDGNITVYNYVLSEELQSILNTSEIVVSRAGYSSVMDYAALEKKAILIPTRNQTEQEYLGGYLANKQKAICVNENIFSFSMIEEAKKIKGIYVEKFIINKALFSLFKRK
ncbi:MAG: glycosyltransferase [Flavobacteriaceae bacterium]